MNIVMIKPSPRLEALFDKVRALPTERLQIAVEALEDITNAPLELSDEELSILRPALERARRGEFAPDAEAEDLLNKPWA